MQFTSGAICAWYLFMWKFLIIIFLIDKIPWFSFFLVFVLIIVFFFSPKENSPSFYSTEYITYIYSCYSFLNVEVLVMAPDSLLICVLSPTPLLFINFINLLSKVNVCFIDFCYFYALFMSLLSAFSFLFFFLYLSWIKFAFYFHLLKWKLKHWFLNFLMQVLKVVNFSLTF